MPDKKYSGIEWQFNPTTNVAQLRPLDLPLATSIKKYTAQLRKVSFKYPSGWVVKPTIGIEQDEVPLLISEPAQPLDPNIGFFTFMEGVWGFKTKADALAYLKSPIYKAVRNCILTTSFV